MENRKKVGNSVAVWAKENVASFRLRAFVSTKPLLFFSFLLFSIETLFSAATLLEKQARLAMREPGFLWLVLSFFY